MQKNRFDNQTSLKGFSTFLTISLAFSIAIVIPALLIPFIAISHYDYDYSGVNDEERSDEEEAAIAIETDQPKPVNHMGVDQSKLVTRPKLIPVIFFFFFYSPIRYDGAKSR